MNDETVRPLAISVEGLPTAARFGNLTSTKAKQLALYALHEKDILFCIRTAHRWRTYYDMKDEDAADSAFIACITKFIGCFQSANSRFALDAKTIFHGHTDSIDAYEYFKNLRNKHVIHDENGFHQSLAVAVFDGNEAFLGVRRITFQAIPRPETHLPILLQSLQLTLSLVQQKLLQLEEHLVAEVNAMTGADRRALSRPAIYRPQRQDAGIPRGR